MLYLEPLSYTLQKKKILVTRRVYRDAVVHGKKVTVCGVRYDCGIRYGRTSLVVVFPSVVWKKNRRKRITRETERERARLMERKRARVGRARAHKAPRHISPCNGGGGGGGRGVANFQRRARIPTGGGRGRLIG